MHGHASVESHLKRNGDRSMFAGWLFDVQQVLKPPHSPYVSFSAGVFWGVKSSR